MMTWLCLRLNHRLFHEHADKWPTWLGIPVCGFAPSKIFCPWFNRYMRHVYIKTGLKIVAVQTYEYVIIYEPRQGIQTHDSSSTVSPWQCWPPLRGAGAVHERVRCRTGGGASVLRLQGAHADHSDHSVKPPSTTARLHRNPVKPSAHSHEYCNPALTQVAPFSQVLFSQGLASVSQ